MDTDSPASYPKHLMASEHNEFSRYESQVDKKMATPVLTHEQTGGYEPPMYRPSNYYQGHGAHHGHGGQYYSPPHQPPRQYMSEMDSPNPYGSPVDANMRPRKWACDYCNVATFVSYEEACAHEEDCARRHHEQYGHVHPSRGPIPQYDRAPPGPPGPSLGHPYHAELTGPPVPYRKPMWDTRGPPMPHFEHHQPYPPPHGHGAYHTPPRYQGYTGYPHETPHSPHHYQPNQKRMLLAMPTDADSLSDRQCYVRSDMVEIFAATDTDVSARHSKGAQKLVIGQVGIRCIHCAHLRPRDRAERAVCYPSSVSRIYQTVADMQRFHFEQCRQIPNEIRKVYKSLKTTRPRGVGSPQTYWVQSARLLDLTDSETGIKFSTQKSQEEEPVQEPEQDPEPVKLVEPREKIQPEEAPKSEEKDVVEKPGQDDAQDEQNPLPADEDPLQTV